MTSGRLLLVDDDPQIGRLMSRVASSAGYQTVVTRNAEAFRCEYRSGAVDVVALDLSMQDGDGIQILRFLAEENCKAPIVIMSGMERRIVDSAARLGQSLGLTMADFLLKPSNIDDIRSVLTRASKLAVTGEGKADLATDLRFAIERGELSLAYQPKIDLGSGRVAGIEALMRWQHPARGSIAPSIFIPLAEHHKFIDQLTEWGVREALRQCAVWDKSGLVLDLAFNISPLTMSDVAFPDELEKLCLAEGVQPARITLEVTESATQDPVWLIDILTRLRLKGMKAAIDDFGTGYSSLLQLRRLPFTELKIDQAFVGDLLTAPDCVVIVKALVDLASGLGMQTTAEGAESAAVLALLRELGCDMAQGFAISPPMAPDELADWAGRSRGALING